MLNKIGFVKTALSPELMHRASNKAAKEANRLAFNSQMFQNVAIKDKTKQSIYNNAAIKAMNLSKKKASQSVKFLAGALKIKI